MGGQGSSQGEREKAGENPRNKVFFPQDDSGSREEMMFQLPKFKSGEFVFAAVAFPSSSEAAVPRAGRDDLPSPLPRGCSLGTNRLAHLLRSPGAYKERQLA